MLLNQASNSRFDIALLGFLFSLLALLMAPAALAEDGHSTRLSLAQKQLKNPMPQLKQSGVAFDVVPMLGTSAHMMGEDERSVSLGLLGTYAGGIDGVELATGFAIDRYYMHGLQLSAGFNMVMGEVGGVQGSGSVNMAMGNLRGAQFVGGLNVASGSMHGAQFAGGVNYARGLRGVQFAGGVNVAWEESTGAQFGTVNLSGGKMNGVQFGVVNVAKNADFAMGVVNIMWDGRTHVNTYGADTGFYHLEVKHGGDYWHGIYTAGAQGGEHEASWVYGLGFGGHLPIGRFFIDADVLGQQVKDEQVHWDDVSFLGTARLVAGFNITKWLAVTGGVSANAYFSDRGNLQRFGNSMVETYRDNRGGRTGAAIWPGFQVGLQLL